MSVITHHLARDVHYLLSSRPTIVVTAEVLARAFPLNRSAWFWQCREAFRSEDLPVCPPYDLYQLDAWATQHGFSVWYGPYGGWIEVRRVEAAA